MGIAAMTEAKINPIQQLAEAARKVWPDALWKQVPHHSVPVVHLDVKTGSGHKWRIFDCTHDALNEAQIAYLRSVIFKSTHHDIVCVVVSIKDTETEEALYENVYAVHPGFMATRLATRISNDLEILDSPEDVLTKMPILEFFINIEQGNVQFEGHRAYLGNLFIEYINHYCKKCQRDLFIATGMIPTAGNAEYEVSEYGREVHHIGIDECAQYLDKEALQKLSQVDDLAGIPVAPLVWIDGKGKAAGSFQSICPFCDSKQKNGALAFNIRLDKLDNSRTDRARTFKYVQIMEDGFIWDYDLVESRKGDPDLFSEIGIIHPGWTLTGS